VLIELRHRSALRVALQGRDEASIQPIFKWIIKHVTDPRYVDICVDSALLLLDLYSEHVGDSRGLGSMVRQLHGQVKKEVERSQYAWQVKGMLDMLMVKMP